MNWLQYGQPYLESTILPYKHNVKRNFNCISLIINKHNAKVAKGRTTELRFPNIRLNVPWLQFSHQKIPSLAQIRQIFMSTYLIILAKVSTIPLETVEPSVFPIANTVLHAYFRLLRRLLNKKIPTTTMSRLCPRFLAIYKQPTS